MCSLFDIFKTEIYLDIIPQDLLNIIFLYLDIDNTLLKYNVFDKIFDNKYMIHSKLRFDFPFINEELLSTTFLSKFMLISIYDAVDMINGLKYKYSKINGFIKNTIKLSELI